MGYKLKKIYIHTPNTTHNLPSEYQEVEYIQSSGDGSGTGQYINTGISIESGVSLKVEMDFHWLNTSTSEREMFAYYEGQYSDYLIGFSSGDFLTVLNSHTAGSLPATWTPNTYATNTRYKVVAEGVTASSTNTPYLFASNENGTDKWDISAKLYYCKVWKDNVLQRDFIPCYRKLDDEIGLYDLVNNQFYANSGTGTFTKGNDVLPTIEHEVRPGTWNPGSNTVAYYPFENNILDETGNTTIGSGSLTQDGLGYRPTSNAVISVAGYNAYYINVWICIKSYTGNTYIGLGNNQRGCGYYVKHANASLNRFFYVFTNTSYNIGGNAYFSPTVNTWHNISYGYDGTKVIYSIDGVTNTLYNGAGYNFSNNLFLDAGNYIVSRYIVENKARTADEIANYYNQTKANYGL